MKEERSSFYFGQWKKLEFLEKPKKEMKKITTKKKKIKKIKKRWVGFALFFFGCGWWACCSRLVEVTLSFALF